MKRRSCAGWAMPLLLALVAPRLGAVEAPHWMPEFSTTFTLADLPEFSDGQLVRIDFQRNEVDIRCLGAPQDRVYSLYYPDDPAEELRSGGVVVRFSGPVQGDGERCVFSGVYVKRDVTGVRQGWMSIQFVPATGRPDHP